MTYDVSTIKEDIKLLSQHDFFVKYYLSEDIWYFEEFLHHKGEELTQVISRYQKIIADVSGITTNDIFMIGSAKIGVSLTPPKPGEESKLFKPFNDDETIRKKSDIDIAIVSQELFDRFWKLYRTSYNAKYEAVYSQHIIRETYRGFINEKNVSLIPAPRKEWNDMVRPIKSRLKKDILFRHEINFRVYRTIDDFEDYSFQTINNLKRGKYYETI